MAPSALDADSILDYMVKVLPRGGNSTESPPIKNPYSAIAVFCHSCMLAVGFRLIGLGEDHRIEAQTDSQETPPLPAGWDASTSYGFRYAHSQSSMEYLLKVTRLGDKALVHGVGLGADKTASMEVIARDYVSEGSLKSGPSDPDLKSYLKNTFISAGRMSDLSSLFKTSIIQMLAPGIRKEGYEDDTITSERPQRQEEQRQPQYDPLRDYRQPPARPYPFDDPLAEAPRRPRPAGDFPPPGFEDEHEILRPPRGIPGGRNPLPIGERDLYPPGLGPNDPLRMGPGGGFRGGGGMHPTFDDPIFGGQGGAQPYDPHVPFGARYDPVGPGDGPPNARGEQRFPGGPRGGVGGNPFGGFGGNDFI